MRPHISACCIVAALIASTVATAEHLPPGWVDYTTGNWSSWKSSFNNQTSARVPFTFSFYGEEYTTNRVFLQANGYLGPGPNLYNSSDPAGWPFSSGGWKGSRRIIAPLWYDFRPSWEHPGYVYYGTVGSEGQQRFVATWDTHTAANQRNIFQAQLHEATGDMSFHYLAVDGPEAGSRVGINRGDGKQFAGFWYDGGQNSRRGAAHNANQQGPTRSLEGSTITYTFDHETDSYQATHAHTPAPGALIATLLALGGVVAVRRRKTPPATPAD